MLVPDHGTNATHAGLDPEQVGKEWITTYLLDQREGRRGNGFTSLYEDLRAFWRWWAAEHDRPNPMASFPRPKIVSTETHVLSEEELTSSWRPAPASATSSRYATGRSC